MGGSSWTWFFQQRGGCWGEGQENGRFVSISSTCHFLLPQPLPKSLHLCGFLLLLRWEDFPKSAVQRVPYRRSSPPPSLSDPSVSQQARRRRCCCFDAGFDRFVCCCIHLLRIRELTGRKMKICLRFSARLFGGSRGRTPPLLHIHIFPYPKSRWLPAPNGN